ncbi:MAG: hypothetical protein IJD65_07040 [Mailhella sp.]|nr:hypothetical protein [Mailhella sp.]
MKAWMNANYDKNEKIRADIFLKIKYDIRDARIGYSGYGEIYAALYFFERINISDGVAGMQIFLEPAGPDAYLRCADNQVSLAELRQPPYTAAGEMSWLNSGYPIPGSIYSCWAA